MKKLLFVASLCSASLLSNAQISSHQDPSFGNGGIVTMPFSDTGQYGNWFGLHVALQDNKKIIAVGHTNLQAVSAFGMIRFNQNGTVDSSFGYDGRVFKRIVNGNGGTSNKVLIQPDGKIIVTGYDEDHFCAFRFLPDGQTDTSFNRIGEVRIERKKSSCNGAVLQTDGKILLCGYSNSGHEVNVIRINADGTPDSSFGTNSTASFGYGTYGCYLNSIIVKNNGHILACGSASDGNYYFLLLQLQPNGRLDSNFGTNGAVLTTFNSAAAKANDLAVQLDGKIIVSGVSVFDGILMARYHTDGSLDKTFGNDGKVLTTIANGKIASEQIRLYNNDKIYAGGYINKTSTDDDFYLIRYNNDGTIDESFAKEGIETDIGSGKDRIHDMLILPDGNILLSGEHESPTGKQGGMVRYTPFPLRVVKTIEQRQIAIVPNPITSNLNITDLPQEQAVYIITDMQGKQIRSGIKPGNTTQTNIDVSYFPSGIYTIKFLSKNNHLFSQFLKQ